MAKKRKRRLITRRRLKWLWVPIVAFALVVTVAWGSAVWTPIHTVRDSGFGPSSESDRNVPPVLLRIYGEVQDGSEARGFGNSHFYVLFLEYADDSRSQILLERVSWTCRAGIPFRALRWTYESRLGPDQTSLWERGIETRWMIGVSGDTRRVPLMPEPVGLTLNVLIYSAAIVLARFAWRRVVVLRRRRKELCLHCAYPLGDFVICPECGNPTTRKV